MIKDRLNEIHERVSLVENSHYYVDDKTIPEEHRAMPRVSSVLDRLFPVTDFVDQLRRKAAPWGTAMHKYIEELTYDTSYPVDQEFRYATDSWFDWISNSGLKVMAVEQKLYYYNPETHARFAGTCDLIGYKEYDDGRRQLFLIDYKSSSKIRPENALQLCAYTLAMEHILSGILSTGIRAQVLKLPKSAQDNPLSLKECRDIEWQKELFLSSVENQVAIEEYSSHLTKWLTKKAMEEADNGL